jgi:putative membrane protein
MGQVPVPAGTTGKDGGEGGVIENYYDVLLGLHIIAVIAWMAGLLYLPRIYVYHTRAAPGSEMDETFKVMEQKLLRIIMTPAMIVVVIFGLSLVWVDMTRLGPTFWDKAWFLVKITGVLALLGWHGFLSASRRAFAENRNKRSERFWRMSNELPFLIAAVVVLSATIKYGSH